MSGWCPKTLKTGGLPNITFKLRKPKSLCTIIRNGAVASTGIIVNQNGAETHTFKWWVRDASSLPQAEPVMIHIAELLHQCDRLSHAEGGWAGRDA